MRYFFMHRFSYTLSSKVCFKSFAVLSSETWQYKNVILQAFKGSWIDANDVIAFLNLKDFYSRKEKNKSLSTKGWFF